MNLCAGTLSVHRSVAERNLENGGANLLASITITGLTVFNGLVLFYAFPAKACLAGAPDTWIGNWKLAHFFPVTITSS
jgi:hypothetical protein